MTQQKAIEFKREGVLFELHRRDVAYWPGKIEAYALADVMDLEAAGYVPASELEAVRLELERVQGGFQKQVVVLEAERARAKEAERQMRMYAGLAGAASARVARLEEVIALALRQGAHADCIRILEAALSTAPQASTEQCVHRVNSLGHCMRCGARPYDRPIVQASTEQPPCKKCGGVGFTLEGTEGDGFSVVCSCQDSPTPAEPQGWLAEGIREAANVSPEMKAHVAAHPSGFLPAEPQGRPEQVGDRVDQLRADVVEALRGYHRGETSSIQDVADEIENRELERKAGK